MTNVNSVPTGFNLYDFAFSAPIRLTDCDRTVTYSGNGYLPFPIQMEAVAKSSDPNPDAVSIKASGIDRAIISIVLNEVVQGKEVVIRRGYWTAPGSYSNPYMLYQGAIDVVEIAEEKGTAEVRFDIRNDFARWDTHIPRATYSATCNWKFKSTTPGCQYTGTASLCNRTFERCMELGNVDRFRGFPHLSAQDGKEIWWGKDPYTL